MNQIPYDEPEIRKIAGVCGIPPYCLKQRVKMIYDHMSEEEQLAYRRGFEG